MNRTWKTPPGPLSPTLTADWPVGQVRLVVAEGLAVSVERLSVEQFAVHSRVGVPARALEGKPSKLRVRRGVAAE
jgi:hypothetical protein